ncbi:MAG: type I-U CRISPR-associated helicase/endonuclease Cas3 [Lentisphaeria bacterium]|jgi:CRISPR-associated endonuclease/helicase Cas3
MNLTPDRFAEFFAAIHGHNPFPWQARLLREVLETGWTRPVALPTASGKTAVLDIALFALACQAHLPPERRTMPRRIALIVDRRVVVDDAARRAERIRDALAEAQGGILKETADALRTLGGEPEEPVHVAVLRGGLYREERWARTPVQPTILLSTVDQVGSRLLFRGYGLSPFMWPIHAGLLANDSLLILDEAHVSQPFLETLGWIAKYREMAAQPLKLPFAFVPMTATPPPGITPFGLNADDRQNGVLAQRLAAGKNAALAAGKGKKDADFAKELLAAARPMLAPGRTVAIVANRVATARAVFELLKKGNGRGAGQDAILLTGRSRAFGRDALLAKWRPRLAAGRNRADSATAPPLVVVATQCIEVGADFDFDALVTECAPLDALRQRFGRLDRLGECCRPAAAGLLPGILVTAAPSNGPAPPRAAIVVREDAAKLAGEPAADPVYGAALAETWRWLAGGGRTQVDFGVAALDAILPAAEGMAKLLAPATRAPVIFPAYCDLWAQTSPEPAVSPEPAIFLHGPQRGEPEVQIVWRADLGDDPARWADATALCPPTAAETLSLRLSVARAWLAGGAKADFADADLEGQGVAEDEGKSAEPSATFRPALRWRGSEESALAPSAADIRPGDLLVAPAAYGGCDEFGWNPASQEPVADIAERVQLSARRRAILRLHPALADTWGEAATHLLPLCQLDAEAEAADPKAACQAALAAVAESAAAPDWLKEICAALAKDKRRALSPHPAGGWVLVGTRRLAADGASDFSDAEDAAATRIGRNVPLATHAADVRQKAEAFLSALGVPAAITADLILAASLHDLGKADPRFQTWLCGGDRLAALRAGLLAKSATLAPSPAAAAAARQKSGYPQGGRHELLSVRLAESADGAVLRRAHDRNLVLHLLASHHGRCRGFAPVVEDGTPVDVALPWDGHALAAASATGLERLDSGVAERFWALVRKHGWWGLAFLEACLRLADHRASELEEEIEEDAP